MHINCLRTRFSLHRQERNQNRTLVSASFSFLVERGEASLATKENKTPHISKKKERIRFECTSPLHSLLLSSPAPCTARKEQRKTAKETLRSPYTSEGMETPQSIHLMNPISCVRKPAAPSKPPTAPGLDCGRTLPHIIRNSKEQAHITNKIDWTIQKRASCCAAYLDRSTTSLA
jgi:hypothetical protein